MLFCVCVSNATVFYFVQHMAVVYKFVAALGKTFHRVNYVKLFVKTT